MEITESIARRVLEVVDAGLSQGKGQPVPGNMCVEAAVCYAMGLPHSDEPPCVHPALRTMKIILNDGSWGEKHCRAKAMRRLAVLQLGSIDSFNVIDFVSRLIVIVTNFCLLPLLRSEILVTPVSSVDDVRKLIHASLEVGWEAHSIIDSIGAAIERLDEIRLHRNSRAVWIGESAVDFLTRIINRGDHLHRLLLIKKIEDALIDMKVPGVQWLPLCEEAKP